MFIQYYRYRTRYHCEQLRQDHHLTIAYPAEEHGIITAAHDFYVIGTFKDCKIDNRAKLTVELIELDGGRTVRTVETDRKNGPLFADYAGIVSEESREAIAASGMPDLAYDPEHPESFLYTWNKAYYSDIGFSALIYGGSYDREGICQYDQFGKLLEPLAEGFYEVRVTLCSGSERYVSAKKILLATGQKEIILSRFSPQEHVEIVERFADEGGFEPFTDPYAGIWDPQYFHCPWHSMAYLEIPARWHWGDAQEYESGLVHCFNHNISQPCVSYRIEIANMLRQDVNVTDRTDRLKFYYYPMGKPSLEETAAEQLEVMPEGRYAFFTGVTAQNGMIRVSAVYKPIPTEVQQISGCEYDILNRISHVDLILHVSDGTCVAYPGQEVGVWKQKDDGSWEFLVLQSEHVIPTAQIPAGAELTLIARDLHGRVWDEITTAV